MSLSKVLNFSRFACGGLRLMWVWNLRFIILVDHGPNINGRFGREREKV